MFGLGSDEAEMFVQIVTILISAAAAIAAVTPISTDDKYVTIAQKWWKRVRRIINIVGLNFGGAKNEGEVSPLTSDKTKTKT